jgi:hypothetical protein
MYILFHIFTNFPKINYFPKKPNTIELKNKIKKYQSFEQYIAKKNNTDQAYEKFWAPIYIILN